MTKQKEPFKVGDRVSFGGLKGSVISINDSPYYPIKVSFDNETVDTFMFDGKFRSFHTKALLKKLRKKKKVREVYLNIYKDNKLHAFSIKQDAKDWLIDDSLETAVRFVRAKVQE